MAGSIADNIAYGLDREVSKGIVMRNLKLYFSIVTLSPAFFYW